MLLPNPPKADDWLFWPKPPLPNPNDIVGDVVAVIECSGERWEMMPNWKLKKCARQLPPCA